MIRTQLVAAKLATLALVVGAAVSSTSSAYALPHFGIHQHPADPNDARILVDVYNKSESFRDVMIEGHVYTVLPHHTLTIKAPEGTPVYTETTGAMHHKGDLLFSVDRSMKNKVLSIN